jgi:hypothetical protein
MATSPLFGCVAHHRAGDDGGFLKARPGRLDVQFTIIPHYKYYIAYKLIMEAKVC